MSSPQKAAAFFKKVFSHSNLEKTYLSEMYFFFRCGFALLFAAITLAGGQWVGGHRSELALSTEIQLGAWLLRACFIISNQDADFSPPSFIHFPSV